MDAGSVLFGGGGGGGGGWPMAPAVPLEGSIPPYLYPNSVVEDCMGVLITDARGRNWSNHAGFLLAGSTGVDAVEPRGDLFERADRAAGSPAARLRG
jgi:hypothetical protein